ncbi:aquaporin [Cristinia sonorae]|uniref:Aquaporin n=1 Tax=Cristinia sonorae TaxID=1940300 RepID=A0A8K0XKD7_9AGAR|nr:aquaporin [Cristinia sonorae]
MAMLTTSRPTMKSMPSEMSDSITIATTHIESPRYPNRWSKIRKHLREPAAEFLGVLLLVLFGSGVNAQTTLSASKAVSTSPAGDYTSAVLGWGVGLALGGWVSAGISGGHINPAVTISFALLRDFPWKKVPAYITAQVLGGICGAGIVYANYHQAIDLFENGARTLSTAGFFGTFTAPHLSAAGAFFEEFLGTAVLLLVICAVTDKRNSPPPSGLVPLVLFFTLMGIAAAIGWQTGFALNPARDFGPRALTAMVGYGKQVFTYRNHYWIWCGIMAPILGGITGVFAYDALIFTGDESVLNRSFTKTRQLRHQSSDESV